VNSTGGGVERGDVTVTAAVYDVTATLPSLSKRALELGQDPGVSLAEGAQHLVRLAHGRSLPLELAVANLDRERASSFEREYARQLLRVAIGEVAKLSRSDPEVPD
jgi:hypothetical protein